MTEDPHDTTTDSSSVGDEMRSKLAASPQGPRDFEMQSSIQVPEKSTDPNVVDWDGPDDPENPHNWSRAKRFGHVVMISVTTLVVNLAATMFAPGEAKLMAEFDVTSSTVGTFTVSIYMLGLAFGPLLLAPLSELYGRQIIYLPCMIIYFGFTIGCAKSTSIGMFLAFRFIAGVVASAPLTIGGGTIADVMPVHERGRAMGAYALGPVLGPVIGPIAGGFMAETIGWRWTFWLIAILSGIVAVAMVLFMRETFAKTILERKAARLRKETNNPALSVKGDLKRSPRELFTAVSVRSAKILFTSPVVLLLSIYVAFVFGCIFLLFTTFAIVFREQYGFNTGISGLSYLGLGISMFIGVLVFGRLSDRILKQKAAKRASKPEDRLPLMVAFSPTIPIGFFWYGWSAQARTHWIVPILGTSFIGFGALFVMIPTQIYLVDAFGSKAAASALAANTVLRCLASAFIPLAGPHLYAALGLGWGNSLLGFLALAFTPFPFLFYRYGEYLRVKFPPKL